MKKLEVAKRKIDLKQYVKRTALATDIEQFITDETMVYCDGLPIIYYAKLPDVPDNLLAAVKRLKFSTAKRTEGLTSQSATFGFLPRNLLRRDYCSAAATAYNSQAEHSIITRFGQALASLYSQRFPDVYGKHLAEVTENTLAEYLLPGTPFTSGIVNKDNPLKYHYDAGNVPGMFSNMIVLRYGTSGGHLVCPEYGITLECANNSVVLFDGQKILHGVTPIVNVMPHSFRFSLVYYSLRQMWNCLPLTEETARIRQIHTLRERRRANGEVPANALQYGDAGKPKK